jgi:hypothetical protein
MLPSIVGLINGVSAPVSTNSYESIATVNVGIAGSSTITFSSIPNIYSHLQLRIVAKQTALGTADGQFTAYFNGDSTNANYHAHNIYATGSSVGAQDLPGTSYNGAIVGWASNISSNGFMANIIDILDYTNTNKNKVTRTLAGFDNNGNGEIDYTSSLWLSTAAINQIVLTPSGGNFAQYSQFALYGVK